jgi:hypothetical protein
MYNQMKMTFEHADGRRFRAERGKVTFMIGKEPDHMMNVIRGKYDWGLHTTRDLHVTEDNLYPLVMDLIDVFNVSWLNSIQDAEAYFLFSEEYVAHEGPLGIVNIYDESKVFIFDDFYAEHP